MVLFTSPVWLHDSGSSKEAASTKCGWWYFVWSKITSPKDGTQTSCHLICNWKLAKLLGCTKVQVLDSCGKAIQLTFWYTIATIEPKKIIHKVLQENHPSLSDHQIGNVAGHVKQPFKYHPNPAGCLAKDMAPTFDRPHLIRINQLQKPWPVVGVNTHKAFVTVGTSYWYTIICVVCVCVCRCVSDLQVKSHSCQANHLPAQIKCPSGWLGSIIYQPSNIPSTMSTCFLPNQVDEFWNHFVQLKHGCHLAVPKPSFLGSGTLRNHGKLWKTIITIISFFILLLSKYYSSPPPPPSSSSSPSH